MRALVDMARQLLERCTFPPVGTAVDCAVSGGADSLTLMVLAGEAGCSVTAIHVDHGIRAGSERDADVVRAAAERFGVRFDSRRVAVEPGPNVEARARAARYRVLPPSVLTGHTADDQAETVLLNLLRGAGLDGLAGMRDENHPIMRLRRAETHAFCAELGLEPIHDPMNDDARLLRNRIRHELLPLMDALAGRDTTAVLVRQTEQLRQDADFLNELATRIDVTDALELAAAPVSLATRALRHWLRSYIDDERHPPSAASIDRVVAVARGYAKACEIEGGGRISRTHQRLRYEPPA